MPSQLNDHPERDLLASEIHTRPHPELTAPVRISHIARLTGEAAAEEERAHLGALCARYTAPPPTGDVLHYNVRLGDFRLLWERHTEFSTYTMIAAGGRTRPFERNAIELLAADWQQRLIGETIAACHIVLEASDAVEPGPEDLATLFEGQRVMGSAVMGGAAEVFTAFRTHGDGFGRYLVHDHQLTAGQAGRLVQRLWELDTYSMMALLALPVAREAAPRLSAAEQTLARLTAATAAATDLRGQREALDELFHLAAEVEQWVASTAYRFGAARAYEGIVTGRLRELDERRVRGLQPLGEFLERRFLPAMRTCRSVEGRQESLSQRIARAADVMRTRVNLQLEAQNQELLASMDQRARLQLRLQQTVEGLSVVAISYYAVGLLAYLADGAEALGAAIPLDLALALATPFVVIVAWLGLRRMRRRLGVKERS